MWSVIYFCFFLLDFFGRLVFRTSVKQVLVLFHLFSINSGSGCCGVSSVFRCSYLFLSSMLYLSLYSCCFSRSRSICYLAFVFIICFSLTFIITLTGLWSELMSAPGRIFDSWCSFWIFAQSLCSWFDFLLYHLEFSICKVSWWLLKPGICYYQLILFTKLYESFSSIIFVT